MQEDGEEDGQAQQEAPADDGPHVTFNEQEMEESKRLIRDEIGSSDDEAEEQDASATDGVGQSEEAKQGASAGQEG